MRKISKCYMCDKKGDTREHVPPKTFFPVAYRNGLWIVKACPNHNTANSKDVEYVAGIVINAIESGGEALEESQDKVFRAFDKSKGLFLGTFKDIIPIRQPNGELTATFRIDTSRFNYIFQTIAYGTYFYENEKTYEGMWTISCPQLNSYEDLHKDQEDKRTFLFDNLSEMEFVEVEHPQPDVFKCAVFTFSDGRTVYRFILYGGFYVYAIDSLIFEIMTQGRI